MKRFTSLLSLVLLNLVPFSFTAAQPSPALDALKGSAAGFSFSAPAHPVPALYKAAKASQYLTGEQLFAYLHEATAPALQKAIPSYKSSKAYMYSKADNTGCNGGPGIITAYSQLCVNGSSDNGDSYKEQGD